jgi:hypothetical protein
MAYVKEYPNGKAVDHYREGVVVQAFVDRTTSVQGEITRIMGEFLEITHPDGNVWTVERKNLQGVITRVVWDGLCEKMITQAHDDGGTIPRGVQAIQIVALLLLRRWFKSHTANS